MASPDVKLECVTETVLEVGECKTNTSNTKYAWTPILVFCLPIALVCVLVWIDEGILATAIPQISDEFDSFDQIDWYGPSYLCGLCVSQLPFGWAYKSLPPRAVYLFSLLVFEAASILQAAAPSSSVFVAGRMLSGVGGAGVLAGSVILFTKEIPKSKVAYVMGSFGWVHAIANIAGPVIGGALTSSSLTWRWCFYLNPIISAPSVLMVLYLWRGKITQKIHTATDRSMWSIFRHFDYTGMLIFTSATVLLLLSMQFGGFVFTWSDSRAIGTLVGAVVMYLVFVAHQKLLGDSAMMPFRILRTGVIALGSSYMALSDAAFFSLAYQLPLWFQGVENLTARDSGFRMLPMLVTDILSGMAVSILTGKLRYYQPWMLLGSVSLTVGGGVLTTLRLNQTSARWIIGEILVGIGTSTGSLPLIALQDTLLKDDVPIGIGIVLTAGYLGSSVGLAVCQAIFASLLERNFTKEMGSLTIGALNGYGITDLRTKVAPDMLERFLDLYSNALRSGWYFCVVVAGLSTGLVFGFGWKRMELKDEEELN